MRGPYWGIARPAGSRCRLLALSMEIALVELGRTDAASLPQRRQRRRFGPPAANAEQLDVRIRAEEAAGSLSRSRPCVRTSLTAPSDAVRSASTSTTICALDRLRLRLALRRLLHAARQRGCRYSARSAGSLGISVERRQVRVRCLMAGGEARLGGSRGGRAACLCRPTCPSASPWHFDGAILGRLNRRECLLSSSDVALAPLLERELRRLDCNPRRRTAVDACSELRASRPGGPQPAAAARGHSASAKCRPPRNGCASCPHLGRESGRSLRSRLLRHGHQSLLGRTVAHDVAPFGQPPHQRVLRSSATGPPSAA